MRNEGVISSVVHLQLFSEKSLGSLFAGARQFYPLYTALLNFNEHHRRAFTTTCKTVTVYLPVKIGTKVTESFRSSAMQAESPHSSRRVVVRSLNGCIEH